jgi:hypothetical protein
MNLLLLLPLAVPFGCLALVSLLAFLGVVALAGRAASGRRNQGGDGLGRGGFRSWSPGPVAR